jgi:uncharacterized membrane protein YraQ (UPF0718 family)
VFSGYIEVLSRRSIKEFLKTMPLLRLVFPALVLLVYLALWHADPENTLAALQISIKILTRTLLPICIIFLLIIGLNVFLHPPHLLKFLAQGTSIKKKFFAAVAGIISAGPIYAWYPLLKELREKGAEDSLVAVFLVNRAVKPFLLPMMISFFGWTFSLAFTLLIVAGSIGVGAVVGALSDRPAGSHPSDERRKG